MVPQLECKGWAGLSTSDRSGPNETFVDAQHNEGAVVVRFFRPAAEFVSVAASIAALISWGVAPGSRVRTVSATPGKAPRREE